ncbi:MAG: hypothetical protein AAB462_04845, partial [Patescibacteria group bacterium]
ATAVNIVQGGAATALNLTSSSTGNGQNINLTNTAGTQTAGLAITRNGAGGTTTSLLNLTNTAGTVTNGILLSGTYTNLINGGAAFNVTNAGAVTTGSTINTATISGGTLSGGTVSGGTLTGTAVNNLNVSGTAISGTGSLTVDANGAGTISLGATSTGDILLGGGSGSTGCTVTNSTGALACAAGLQGTTLTATAANGLTLGTSSSATGGIVFRGSGGAGTLTVAGPTTPNAGNFTLSIPAITANANICTDNSVCTGYQAAPVSGSYLQQVPTSTAANTVTPTANSVVGLTVNGTSGTAATAVVINQAGATGALTINNSGTSGNVQQINVNNTSGTVSAGLLINRSGAGGTTSNLIQLTNSSGTATNAILISGTYTSIINAGAAFTVGNTGNITAGGTYNSNTFTSSALQFGAASTATIQSAASQALNITGNAASTISTTAGNLTLQAGSGTVSLGTSTNLTSNGALTIAAGGTNTALNIDNNGSGDINIGTNSSATLNGIWIGSSSAAGQHIYIGATATAAGDITLGNAGLATFRSSGIQQQLSSNTNVVRAINSDVGTFQVQNTSTNTVLSVDTSSNQVALGKASTLTGKLLFNSASGSGSISLVPNNPSSTAYTLNLPAENGTICSTGSVCTGYQAAPVSGSYLQQVPTSTAANTVTPTANSVVGLTVNGTSGTAATAVNIVQGGAATALNVTSSTTGDGANINLTNTAGTITNGLLIAKSGAGTATNAINLTGTYTNLINSTNFLVTNAGAITAASTYNTNTFNANTLTFGTAGAATIQGAAGQALNIGSSSNTSTSVNIEAGTAANAIQIGNGATVHGIQIGTGAAVQTVTIGSTNTTSTTNIQGGATGAINIGATGATAINSTVHIADSTACCSNTQTVSIGSASGAANAITIESGNAGLLQIGNGNTAHGIQIGSNATGDNDILLGGANSGSTVTIEGGTAAGAIQIGNGATAHGIQIGTNATAAQVISIGSANASSTFTAEAGTGTTNLFNGATAHTIQLATGAAIQSVTIGSTNSTSALTLQAGTGNLNIGNDTVAKTTTINIGANNTGADLIALGSTNASSTLTLEGGTATNAIQIGNGGTAHGIQIGSNASGDNDILFGSSNSGSTVNIEGGTAAGAIQIGNGTTAHGIQIGSNGTAANAVLIGGIHSGSILTLEGGTATNAIQIGNGTTAHGIQIGSNATGDNDILIGGTNAGSTLTLEAGTNANAILIGNGATAHGIKIGTGAAVQTVQLGSLNTTSSTLIQGGTGTGAITLTGNATSGSANTQVLVKNTNNGTAAFQIQNAAGDSLFNVDTTNNKITIGGNNSGELSTWASTTSLGANVRAYHPTVTANGYVYVIGGWDTVSAKDTSYYAKLNADGSVGTWASTTNLPIAIGDHASVVANGYVYVLGGYNGSYLNDVYYAKLNADGTLGGWNQTTDFPGFRHLPTSVVANGYVYVLGGKDETGTFRNTVYYAKLNADGTVGSWQTANAFTGTRDAHTSVTANGYVYVIGGENPALTPLTSVQYAKVNADGSLSAWQATTGLGTALFGQATVVANGYVYAIGGGNGGGASTSIYYARLNSNGTIGAWNTGATTLPAGRGFFSGVVANGYIYTFGGLDTGGVARGDVYYTSTQRIQVGGALDLVGLGGSNLADGEIGSGGELTAGNTNIVGLLQVAGSAMFAQSVSVGADINIGGTALFKNGTNSTVAFQVQNVAGNNLLAIDTTTAAPIVNIGPTAAVALAGTVNIGTSTGAAQTVNIGSTNASSTLTLEAGTAAGAIAIGNGTTAHSIRIGSSNTGDNDILIGGTNTGSTISIEGGTATNAIQIGNGTTAHGIQIGSSNTGDNDILIGGTNAGSTLTLEAGTNANAILIGNGATAHGIKIGTGAAVQTVQLGSLNTTSSTLIQGGTAAGGITLTATGSSTTGVVVRNSTNSSAAFAVQNTSSVAALSVDTTTNGLNSSMTTIINSNVAGTSGLRFSQINSTSAQSAIFSGILGLDASGNIGLSTASAALTSPALGYWDGLNNPTVTGQSYPQATLSGNAAYDGATNGVRLTSASNGQSGSVNWDFAQVPFERIQYRYKSGGGTGADGTWFYSFADATPTTEYGSGLTKGYIIYFSEYHDCIGITYGGFTDGNQCGTGGGANPLTSVARAGMDDNNFHDIDISINYNKIIVRWDGEVVLTYSDVYTRDFSGTDFGFGARTGGSNNAHYIKGLVVTKLGTNVAEYGIDNVSALSGNMYWDGVNNRLGLGVVAPTRTLDVSGTWGGDTVTTATSNSTTTSTITTGALAYYNQSTDTTGDCNTSDKIFNITGLSNTEGSYAFIVTKATDGGCTSNSVDVTTRINGTTIGTVTASNTVNTTVTESYTVVYINGAWRIVGLNSGTAQGANGSDTADFAEWIPYAGAVEPQAGEILSIDSSGNAVTISNSPYDRHMIGVVSTSPYDVAGQDDGHSVILALTGRVPVKVSLENGPIQAGDPLTSSSTPGVAMKATKAGKIIGTAMNGYDGTQQDAQVIVQLGTGFDDPNAGSGLLQGDHTVDGALTVNGNTALQGNLDITGDSNFASLNVNGTLTVTGDLSVSGTANITNLTVQTANISGTLGVGGDLTVTGSTTTGSLTVTGSTTTGSLTVTGSASVGSLTVSGIASFGGDIRMTGQVNTRQATIKTFKANKAITAGSVVILDDTDGHEGEITTTTNTSDTRVIGVAVTGGAIGDNIDVAISGWVQVRVDTTPDGLGNAPTPLKAGKLLSTSIGEGTVQTPASAATGSIIGKTTSQQDANNLVWILVSLQ